MGLLIECLFIACLLLFIIFPQAQLLGMGIIYKEDMGNHLLEAAGNSFGIALCVSLLGCAVALLCSLAFVYTNIRFKEILYAICISPMMIPPISFGFGILFFLGKNGVCYNLFKLRLQVLGIWGIIGGQLLYTIPPSIMIITDSLRKTDNILYEEASIAGTDFITFVRKILIPQIEKPLIFAFLLDFSMSLADYTIPLVIGGRVRTLSLMIYRLATGVLNLSQAARISILLFAPVVITGLANQYILTQDYCTAWKFNRVQRDRKRDFAGYILLFTASAIVILLLLSFIIMAIVRSYPLDSTICMDNFIKVLSGKNLIQYQNSIRIASGTAIIGCAISFGAAYISFRGKNKTIQKICQLLSCVPRVIPGILFGVGYAMVYNKTELKSTYGLLIIASTFHFLTIPYTMAFNSFLSMSSDYWDLEGLYGMTFLQALIYVYLPYMKDTLREMFYYFFVNTLISISVPVFLVSSKTMMYALILNNFEGSIEYLSNCSAVICILFATNYIIYFILHQHHKYKRLPQN